MDSQTTYVVDTCARLFVHYDSFDFIANSKELSDINFKELSWATSQARSAKTIFDSYDVFVSSEVADECKRGVSCLIEMSDYILSVLVKSLDYCEDFSASGTRRALQEFIDVNWDLNRAICKRKYSPINSIDGFNYSTCLDHFMGIGNELLERSGLENRTDESVVALGFHQLMLNQTAVNIYSYDKDVRDLFYAGLTSIFDPRLKEYDDSKYNHLASLLQGPSICVSFPKHTSAKCFTYELPRRNVASDTSLNLAKKFYDQIMID